MSIFTGRDGALRIYDGTTPTPFYVAIPFVNMDLNAPEARPRPQEKLLPLFNQYVYEPLSVDEILAPVSLSFSLKLEVGTWNKIRQALGLAVSNAGVWTVGANTWTNAFNSTTLYDAKGNAITRPTALNDTMKVASVVEGIWTNPDGTVMGYKWAEVVFLPQNAPLREGETEITLSATGDIYGAISTISAFDTGTPS